MEIADQNKGIVSGGHGDGPIGERGIAGAGRRAGLLRGAVAALLAGLIAGVAFLIFVEWAQRRGLTEVRFNHSLGVLIGGSGTQARSDAALGVSGDTAAPTGLFWFAVICVAVMVLHGLIVPRLVRRSWRWQAVPLALFVFLLVGLVYFPLIGSDRVGEVEVGPFGIGAGAGAPLIYLAGALVFAFVATRVYTLVAAADWWVEREVDTADALREIQDIAGLSDVDPPPASPEPEAPPVSGRSGRGLGGGGMIPPAGGGGDGGA